MAFDLPPVIFVVDLARALRWRTERTRRWLKTLSVLEMRGRKYVTTPTRLLKAFPEGYEAWERYNEKNSEKQVAAPKRFR